MGLSGVHGGGRMGTVITKTFMDHIGRRFIIIEPNQKKGLWIKNRTDKNHLEDNFYFQNLDLKIQNMGIIKKAKGLIEIPY